MRLIPTSFLLLFCLLIVTPVTESSTLTVHGQSGAPIWSYTFGGAGRDYGWSLVEAEAGGFTVAGASNSYGAGGNHDAYLVRTDENGILQWNHSIGGLLSDYTYSIVECAAGGYALTGYSSTYSVGFRDLWLLRVDGNGVPMWNRSFGGVLGDFGRSIVECSDGGFAVVGYSASYSSGDNDIYLVRTDQDGNLLWYRVFGGSTYEYGHDIIECRSGGFIIAGERGATGGLEDAYILRTNETGHLLWDLTFGEAGHDLCKGIIETSDGFLVVGSTDSYSTGNSDLWLIRINQDGILQWHKTYGGERHDSGWSLIEHSTGSIVLIGSTENFGAGGEDLWLVYTDRNGFLLGHEAFGGVDNDYGRDIVELADGSLVLTGYSFEGEDDPDLWLVHCLGLPAATLELLVWFVIVGIIIGVVVVLLVWWIIRRRRKQ